MSLERVSKKILNYGLQIGYTLALTVKTIAHGPMFADNESSSVGKAAGCKKEKKRITDRWFKSSGYSQHL